MSEARRPARRQPGADALQRAARRAAHAHLPTRLSAGLVLSEEQLALEFGVSRTPIRRVLSRLEAEGLVESRHGMGTVVTDPDLETLRQIYALRMRIAELIGELDPLPRAESDLERIRSVLRRVDDLRHPQCRGLRPAQHGVPRGGASRGRQPGAARGRGPPLLPDSPALSGKRRRRSTSSGDRDLPS